MILIIVIEYRQSGYLDIKTFVDNTILTHLDNNVHGVTLQSPPTTIPSLHPPAIYKYVHINSHRSITLYELEAFCPSGWGGWWVWRVELQ